METIQVILKWKYWDEQMHKNGECWHFDGIIIQNSDWDFRAIDVSMAAAKAASGNGWDRCIWQDRLER